jgi:GST-like protein
MPEATVYKLYARAGWGSAIAEAQLAWYGLPYELIEVDDLFKSPAARDELARVNPLAQLPTLVEPDGRVMTESAAITLRLADITGSDALVPEPGEPVRPEFLRWLVFLVANVYPTFTYGDLPTRFVPEAAGEAFRANVDNYARRLWQIVEGAARSPWFLGDRFSALDIYVSMMTLWRPKRPWFAANTPALHAIATRTEQRPELSEVWRRNFPSGGN